MNEIISSCLSILSKMTALLAHSPAYLSQSFLDSFSNKIQIICPKPMLLSSHFQEIQENSYVNESKFSQCSVWIYNSELGVQTWSDHLWPRNCCHVVGTWTQWHSFSNRNCVCIGTEGKQKWRLYKFHSM